MCDKVYKEAMQYRVGDRLNFGRYFQGPGEMGLITWVVVRCDPDGLLILAERGLDNMRYNEVYSSTTWADCTLRHWLNNEFLTSAFNDQERSLIKQSHIDNSAGPATEDYVFLLSDEEVNSIFISNKERISEVTYYAVKKNAYVNSGRTRWWLRSQDSSDDCALCVRADGEIDSMYVSYYAAVRPALHLAI